MAAPIAKNLTAETTEASVIVNMTDVIRINNDGANDLYLKFNSEMDWWILKQGEGEVNPPIGSVRTLTYKTETGTTTFRFYGVQR